MDSPHLHAATCSISTFNMLEIRAPFSLSFLSPACGFPTCACSCMLYLDVQHASRFVLPSLYPSSHPSIFLLACSSVGKLSYVVAVERRGAAATRKPRQKPCRRRLPETSPPLCQKLPWKPHYRLAGKPRGNLTVGFSVTEWLGEEARAERDRVRGERGIR